MSARTLSRDRNGSVAIEFALVAPMIILALLSAFELMRMQNAYAALEAGAAEAARLAARFDASDQPTREAEMRRVVTGWVCAPALDEPGECWWDEDATAPLSVASRTVSAPDNRGVAEPLVDANGNGLHDAGEAFADLNGNGRHDADMGASAAGGAGDLVIYDFTMVQRLGAPPLIAALGAQTTHHVRMAVRNESE